jgi:putative GTP pyrophosphokinase
MKPQSKTEIDQLGETLKHTPVSEASLIALDQFRLTFGSAIDQVRRALNEQCGVQCSLRPSKSTPSIIAKLIRQPTLRLTQIQDIAGLRVIVKDYAEQDTLRDKVVAIYPDCKIYDRREKPSFGYRAVHLVMKVEGALVELQIRTEFQHAWAQMSEVMADFYGHNAKYENSQEKRIKEHQVFSNTMHAYEKTIQVNKIGDMGTSTLANLINLLLYGMSSAATVFLQHKIRGFETEK